MKLAVTYENGNVYQHFGHSEAFKIYEIEEGKILSTEVVEPQASGHDAMAGFLAEQGVAAVICGGIGQGAQDALAASGIVVFSGAEGDADEVVAAFLRGELESAGVNCAHHESGESDEEGCGGCGGDCGGGCGGGCGGCGGGCGGCGGELTPIMEGKNVMKNVKVHYRGTFNDGTQFDASYDRGEPLEFICGVGMMIYGFDQAVANMEVGESVDIHLMPEDAYGMPNPNMVQVFNIAELPGSENLTVGQKVYLQSPMGQPIPVTVAAKDENTVTLDANHEMAGKELNFHIELLEAVENDG